MRHITWPLLALAAALAAGAVMSEMRVARFRRRLAEAAARGKARAEATLKAQREAWERARPERLPEPLTEVEP